MGCPTIPYKQIVLVYWNKELEHFRLFRVNRFAVLSYMSGKNNPAQFTSDFKTRHRKTPPFFLAETALHGLASYHKTKPSSRILGLSFTWVINGALRSL